MYSSFPLPAHISLDFMTTICFWILQKLSRHIVAIQNLSIPVSQLQTMPLGDSSMLVNVETKGCYQLNQLLLPSHQNHWWFKSDLVVTDQVVFLWPSRCFMAILEGFGTATVGLHCSSSHIWQPIFPLHCHHQWLWMSYAPNSQREPGKLIGSITNKQKVLRQNVQFTKIVETLLSFRLCFIPRC